ncbi:bax inhibitor 1 [Phtheirospermum japonicum]|uniref:Bax inhibitor 1 n=1 Tax=Phtheirospermum japonicum TaxID=374723 RepID=A0A830BSR7_9LAMI|nr:bax inhibitor 1 [Phtheirospermum japonicum]
MPLSAVTRRAVDAVKAYFLRGWSRELLSFSDTSPVALRVLRLVYMLLGFAFTSSAFGFYFRDCGIIGGLFAAVGSVTSIVSLCLVAPRLMELRVLLLIAGSFFGGASLGPWVAWILGIDSGSILSALVGISLGFRCYWAASMWAKRYDLFYYSGLYLSGPVVMLWIITASVEFGGHSTLWGSQIYAAVLTFMMYVTTYSQVLVQKIIKRKDSDYVKHAITLFTDSPPVCVCFVYMLVREILRRLEAAVDGLILFVQRDNKKMI